jgi:hypothetical protein
MLAADLRFELIDLKRFGLEAPPGFEPGMEVLQIQQGNLFGPRFLAEVRSRSGSRTTC